MKPTYQTKARIMSLAPALPRPAAPRPLRRQPGDVRLSVGFILAKRFTLCAFANFVERVSARRVGQSYVVAVGYWSTDPAQPYGAALEWPSPVGDTRHRPGRKAGALVVLVSGEAALYVERGGKSLLSFTEDETALRSAAQALARAVREGWLDQLAVQRSDGEGALGSRMAEILTDAGFRATPKGLRLRS